MVEGERKHLRMAGKNRMHSSLQNSNPFPVDNPDLEDPSFLARRQVIRHKVLDLARLERVQIQHSINR